MAAHDGGPSARELEEGRLLKELEAIHRTRHETLLHGSDDALVTHTQRMNELEHEYVRRHPQRAQTASRTRSGARARKASDEETPGDT
ncbi:hypothetical protein SUDANB120_05632 [Streptomyces sp. enrichment culture]|uniref:DUF6158 family protein n=1 Tax=Streptomyces toxytricini TaxID=67369 RepID=A0ABW8EQB5_STRT5|nr:MULTISPECIES: DUF6158 family protein [Streptomyces]MBD3575773.1 hypothetical protein [Streptomyces sp. KD18]GGS82941.1 hypothetical protein GCM10010286_04540 [Streptomyces toxytricini]